MAPILTLVGLMIAQPPAAPAPPMTIDTSFLRLYAETRGFMLGRPTKPKFSPDGQTVFFLRSEAKNPKQKLFAFDVATKQTMELLTPEMLLGGKDEQLSDEEKARRERQRVTAGGFADYHLNTDGTKILVSLSGRLFVFDRPTGKHTELKTGPGACIDPKWSPDGKLIGYVRGFDVYAFDLAAEKETAVTTGGTAVKTNGLAEFVAQEEMGRHSGFWWSPDSKQIAFCEADHTGVEQWAVADPLNPDKLGTPQYYPRPGKKNVYVRLGIATVGCEKMVWVEWDRKRLEYLAAVKWLSVTGNQSPFLTIQLQNRMQWELCFHSVDSQTGQSRELHKEVSRDWVNISPNIPLEGQSGYIWQSVQDGKYEIQDRDIERNLFDIILPTREDVIEVITQIYGSKRNGMNDHGRAIVYYSSPDPTQQHVRFRKYGAWFTTPGSMTEGHLTQAPGIHTAAFGKSDSPYVITSTTLNQLPVSEIRNYAGTISEIPTSSVEQYCPVISRTGTVG